MTKALSLKSKLILMSVFLVLVSVAIGVTSQVTLHQVEGQYEQMVTKTLPKDKVASDLYSEVRNYRLYLRTLVSSDPSKSQKIIEKIAKVEADYAKDDQAYNDLGFSVEQQVVYARASANWQKILEYGHKVVELYKSGRQDELTKLLVDESSLADEYRGTINELLALHEKQIKEKRAEISQTANRGNLISNLILLLGASMGSITGILFSLKISKTLSHLASMLSSGAEKSASLADILSGTAGSLASSTQEQAAAIQESVSALSEMSSMISQTGLSVQHSLASSHDATREAAEGRKSVGLLTSSIASIQKANEQMQEISSIINNIGEKTSVINDIVFKTQLLSFNASIEAARAGAHGRGFSVVAEEVSNLAELSGEAAKEIEVLLAESQTKVKDTLEAIHVRVTDTVKTNRVVQQSFESISELVDKMEEHLKSIGEASKQQELGIQQTNSAMKQMEAAAEENRLSSEKTHTASDQLSAEGRSLSQITKDLTSFVKVSPVKESLKTKVKLSDDTVKPQSIDLSKLVADISAPSEDHKNRNSAFTNRQERDQFFKKAS